MPKTGNGETVKSAVRALDILEFVVRTGRPTAAHEIATTLAIPVSSLSYLLTTLQKREYLMRDGRRYVPGPALSRLQPNGGSPHLKEIVDPLVRSIRDQLNETAAFFVVDDFEMLAISSEVGMHALRFTVDVDQRLPMHAFSAGKALLATMEDKQVKEYLKTCDLQRYTASTICSEDDMMREIVEIRRAGVAHSREEHTLGIHGISKAVLRKGAPIGAFSVAIPAARYCPSLDERIIDLLTRSANILSESEFVTP